MFIEAMSCVEAISRVFALELVPIILLTKVDMLPLYDEVNYEKSQNPDYPERMKGDGMDDRIALFDRKSKLDSYVTCQRQILKRTVYVIG
jgi:hypothetical protein